MLTQTMPKKVDSAEKSDSIVKKDEDETPFIRQKRPNIFRFSSDDEPVDQSTKNAASSNSFEYDQDNFKASNQGLNVGLAAFYSLPKLGKDEAEQIL